MVAADRGDSVDEVIRGWGNYYAMSNAAELFDQLDSWIRMRLRSKVRGSKATSFSNAKMPNGVLASLGLVSLADIRRSVHSPA